MAQDESSDSLPKGPHLAFEMIGVSVRNALVRLNQSELAALQLMSSYFQVKAHLIAEPNVCSREFCRSILDQFDKIGEDSVHSLGKDRRRYALLAAIGILDSFLADTLRFLFLHQPSTIPNNLTEKREDGESDTEYIERIVRRSGRFSSYRKRLNFLATMFKVKISGEAFKELEELTCLRNELAHHGGFYRFSIFAGTGEIWSEAKAIPEVSNEAANKAAVVVTEICDAIYEAMCRNLFDSEPKVRPLTPEVAAVHKGFKQQWRDKRAKDPKVEDFPSPDWRIRVSEDSDFIWITDTDDSFMIVPTGIEVCPALISFRRNDRHGTKARITIDDNPCQELTNSVDIIKQMLEGEKLLIEFNEEPWDELCYARYTLHGFAEVWHAAWRTKVSSGSN